MRKYVYNLYLIVIVLCIPVSCSDSKKQKSVKVSQEPLVLEKHSIEDTLIDSRYTFEEAVAGSRAP